MKTNWANPYTVILIFILSFVGCGKDGGEEDAAALNSFLQPSTSPTKSCAGDLCLEISETSDKTNLAIELKLTGITRFIGQARLYLDSECTTTSGDVVNASTASVSITSDKVTKRKTSFWAKYRYPNGDLSPCIGPVVKNFKKEQDQIQLTITNTDRGKNYLTPTFKVSSSIFIEEEGTAQIFSDSVCKIPASSSADYNTGATITVYDLKEKGNHKLYTKITYENEEVSDCLAGTTYNTEENLTIHSSGFYRRCYPSINYCGRESQLSIGGLGAKEVEKNRLELFSDAACTIPIPSSFFSSRDWRCARYDRCVTINSYGIINYYAKYTDENGNVSSCVGPASDEYEKLALKYGPVNEASSDTIVFTAENLLEKSGHIQLFYDASGDTPCSTAEGNRIAVDEASEILTLSTSTRNNGNNFYIKHTVNESESACVGPPKHKLTLSRYSWGNYSYHSSSRYDKYRYYTPTFKVSGLMNVGGTVKIYSDSNCSTAASNSVNVNSNYATIAITPLDSCGSYYRIFYAKQIYPDGGSSLCSRYYGNGYTACHSSKR